MPKPMAYWRLGLLADKPARGARSGKQAIEHDVIHLPSRLHRHVDRDHGAGDRRRVAPSITATPVNAGPGGIILYSASIAALASFP
jgi:hypothetical protein